MKRIKLGLCAGHSRVSLGATKGAEREHVWADQVVGVVRDILGEGDNVPIQVYEPLGSYGLAYPGTLQDRIEFFNRSGVDFVVSVHFNSVARQVKGYSTSIYWDKPGDPTRYSVMGKGLAATMEAQVAKVLPVRTIGARPQSYLGRDLGLLRETSMPATILEPLFISEERHHRVFRALWYPLGVSIATGIYRFCLERWWMGDFPTKSRRVG